MKQLKIITIGIFAILLTVGLSGCTDSLSDSLHGITDIEDIHKHPNRYLNKEITIKGVWSNEIGSTYDGAVFDPDVDFLCSVAINFSENVNTSILYSGGEYIFRGTLVIIKIWGMDAYCINVVEVKST